MCDRRTFLRGVSALGTTGLLGVRARSAAAEPPPETTKLRLHATEGICIAPQYIANELLQLEGFTDIQYVKDAGVNPYPLFASGKIDISTAFVAPFLVQLDAGVPVVLLGGVHVGCFELFGIGHVRAIRDLKGKRVGIPSIGSAHHLFVSSMAAYVGLDPRKDIEWVAHKPVDSARVLTEARVDALMGFPPVPQELRTKGIGRAIVNSSLDRPWSQYFCCLIAANKEFVRRSPVAAKRAMRAILEATDLCALEPERSARALVDRGFTKAYDYALATMKETPYNRWRDYDPEDAVRFYALRLREIGAIKGNPQKLIAEGTDWRFFNELKKELKG